MNFSSHEGVLPELVKVVKEAPHLHQWALRDDGVQRVLFSNHILIMTLFECEVALFCR
jgi:hypothetical protein